MRVHGWGGVVETEFAIINCCDVLACGLTVCGEVVHVKDGDHFIVYKVRAWGVGVVNGMCTWCGRLFVVNSFQCVYLGLLFVVGAECGIENPY